MTLKEFLEENQVTAFEIVENVVIVNVVVGSRTQGLDVDTSNIVAGTVLKKVYDFTVDDDILTVDGLTLDINTTNLLGGKRN